MLLIFPFLVLYALDLSAGMLPPALNFQTAQLLPPKVFSLIYQQANGNLAHSYDEFGQKKPLANDLNKSINYYDVLKEQKTEEEKNITQAALSAYGITDFNDEAGQITGDIRVQLKTQVPVLAYGVTTKWMSAIAIPIVTAKVQIDSGFKKSESLQNISEAIYAEGGHSQVTEIQLQTQNAIETKLNDYNYEPLRNNEETLLGDIQLLNRYQVQNSADNILTLTSTISLPTGKKKNPHDLMSVESGDGQLDLGFGAIYEKPLPYKWSLILSGDYTYQFADRTGVRVPQDQDDPVTPDFDPAAKRKLGDMWQAQLGTKWVFYPAWSFYTAYSYQFKREDKIDGGLFARERYDWLTQNTQQQRETLLLGIEFNSIQKFITNNFPVPLYSRLIYSKPVNGKNVIEDSLIGVEVAFFYK